MAKCVKEKISNAIYVNPSLTPSEIACGKGLGFIPSAINSASCHTGKVTQQIWKTKQMSGLLDKNWSPMVFEEIADVIDKKDNEIGDSDDEELTMYKKHGRPYLVSTGMENGINIFSLCRRLCHR